VLAESPNLLVAGPGVQAKNLAELIALAKAKPGSLNYSSAGSGTTQHLAGEMFKLRTGTDIVHIPYKGTAPSLAGVISGDVQFSFANVPAILAHVRSGRLHALAVSGTRRTELMPDVPTMKEAGVPGVEVTVWYALLATAGTPREIIATLADASMKAAPHRAGRGADRQHAGGVRQAPARGDREVRRGRENLGREARMSAMRRLLFFFLSIFFLMEAIAQDFPSHPVRLIVPWPPSGNVDITARTVAPAFSEALGQQVIVENRAGAGGTMLLGSTGTITSAPAVFRTIAYDPVKDLVAVGAIQWVPMVLTVGPKTPVSTFQDYFALAKAKPGQVSVASAGNGSSNHLAIELLMRQANLKLLHVPYKGSGPALTDLLGSQVDSMIDQLTASIGYVREGRLRPLAVTSLSRSPLLPNVPTLDELGVKGYEASTFTGIFVPTGTPQAAVDKLHAALKKALANDSVRERYRAMGAEVADMSAADFASYVRSDLEKWRKVAREGNIVVE
jgi:tripartite-type tricarboxylate transporter receptor subunit TctC